jgi:hypothetical protein
VSQNCITACLPLLTRHLHRQVSESLGLLCAIVTRQATFAIIVLTFVLLLVLSFSGFLVTQVSLVPVCKG